MHTATIMSEPLQHQSNINFVGKNIRKLRQQRRWSQEDIASRLGISIPAFSKIETGITDVNLSRLNQIADIFELSIVDLLSSEKSEHKTDAQPGNLNTAQQKLTDRETEILHLQRKVIELYEELRCKNSIAS